MFVYDRSKHVGFDHAVRKEKSFEKRSRVAFVSVAAPPTNRTQMHSFPQKTHCRVLVVPEMRPVCGGLFLPPQWAPVARWRPDSR